MVDRLSLSLEQLSPPICPNCHAEMRSFRCRLVALDPLTSALLTLPQIHEMADRMLAAEAEWLPQFP